MECRFEHVLFVNSVVFVNCLLDPELAEKCSVPMQNSHLFDVVKQSGNRISSIKDVVDGGLEICEDYIKYLRCFCCQLQKIEQKLNERD